MVRTQGFHPCNMDSIPVGVSNYQGVDSAWIEGSSWKGEVIGSNPITLTNGSFVQWFSISDCLSEDMGSIPIWTAMKVNIKM